MSPIIQENGVKVQFADNNYFQFDTCPAYAAIKNASVKETDVCWFDNTVNTLWLIELKAFSNPANPKYQEQDLSLSANVDYWLQEFEKKTIHAVAMTLTNRSNTQSCLTFIPNNTTIIKVVHLVKVKLGQETYLSPMQDKLNQQLSAYRAIFKINSVAIVSYDYALTHSLLPWIVA